MAEVKMNDARPNVRIFYDKGIAAMERANLDYAMDMFEAALEIEPRILQIRHLLRAAAIQKQSRTKSNAFTALISSTKGLLTLLKINVQKKKAPLSALAAIEKLLRNNPLNLKYTLTLCSITRIAEMPEAAIQSLEILSEHHPSDSRILEPLAQLYKSTKQFEKEYDCRNQLVRIKPTDSTALKNLKDAAAQNTMDKAGWDRAESDHDVIKDKPNAPLDTNEASLDQLIKTSLEKIKKTPKNISYHRALADLYLRAKQFDRSIEALEICQKLPGGTDPQIDRALTDTKINQFSCAIEQAKEAGNTQLADQRAKELQTFRFNDTAERVKRYPNDLQFKYNYGILLFSKKMYTEAILQFQLAQRNPQRRIHAHYYLALCFKEKGQLDIAAEQLEKAREELTVMDKTKKDVLYELGVINEALNEPIKALQFYKEIYSVDIGYRDVAKKVEHAYGQQPVAT